MGKILLIYPATDVSLNYSKAEFDTDNYKSIPVGNLALASFMASNGHKVKFIDGRAYPKEQVLSMIEEEISDADVAGFSIMTCQIKHGLILSDFIKKKRPELPVVWGGIHPTLFPEQTIRDNAIDFAIAGEGEYGFLSLVEFLIKKTGDLDKIAGLAYKIKGVIKFNGIAALIDVNDLPQPDYALLDINKYINRTLVHNKRVRGLDILASRGCPYRCSFCTNTFLLKRKWRPIQTEKVLETMDLLIKRYQLNNIWFLDDFFFGDKERPRKIAQHILNKNYNIVWEADIRADNFREDFVNEGYLDLLRKSGLYSLRMGAESGSNETLRLIKKDISSDQTYNAVKQCIKHDIFPVLYFMIGIPGETKKAALQTISFVIKLKTEFPRAWIYGPGIFRLYPGSELYQKCVEVGSGEPDNLREWGGDLYGGYVFAKALPWLKGRQRFIEDLIFLNSTFLALKGQHPHPGLRALFGIFTLLRNKFNFWRLRWEAAAARGYKFIRDNYAPLLKRIFKSKSCLKDR